MSGDWNIVDDSDSPTEPTPDQETRFNVERVRLIARERRAAHKARMLARGVTSLVILTIAIVLAWLVQRS